MRLIELPKSHGIILMSLSAFGLDLRFSLLYKQERSTERRHNPQLSALAEKGSCLDRNEGINTVDLVRIKSKR